jgi:hypothetical protein
MIPAFIVIWAGIIYIYQAYERKIDVMQQTRAAAWHHATNSCRTSPPADVAIDESEYEIDAFISGVVGTLGAAYYPDPLHELEARASDTVEEPRVIGSDTVRLTHRVELMCNEETQELGEDVHYEAWILFGLPEIL